MLPISREVRRMMQRFAEKRPLTLAPVPREKWPVEPFDPKRIEVWLSNQYHVQVFQESAGVLRLSVGRRTVQADGITWDELQEVKRQIGRGDSYAIEIYPLDCDVVNVANLRHLWVMPEPLDYGWRR